MNYQIHDWMISKLKLKGNELLLFALIFSFQKSNSIFYGSYSKIKILTGISTDQTVVNTINKLKKANLIKTEKTDNGIKYFVNRENETIANNLKIININKFKYSYKSNHNELDSEKEYLANLELSDDDINSLMADKLN